jgi:protein-disulfide isomerase
LCLLAVIDISVHAAEPAATPKEPDPALVDAIIRKLDSGGQLDAVVERAMTRVQQRQQQAAQEEEAKRQAQIAEQAKNARPVDAKQDHIRGDSSAVVSLIEYTDFECPFCKQFHGTPKALMDRYGGKLNWVIRNYPLPFHDPAARKEALAAECIARLSGNEAYWKYADAVFANTKSNGGGLPDDKSVEKLAESVGIQTAALSKCMNEEATIKRVEQDIADGNVAGVNGTPTTVVRNNRTGASQSVVGALPADGLVPAIEQMLGAKP